MTIAVAPVLIALVVLDIADRGVRVWFDTHAFTTDALTSVLVLLITVLIVNRVVSVRQQQDRLLVIAAQAAIISRQARRTADLVKESLSNADQRETASDELRTYMAMLLVSAPVLIEGVTARTFLESAQRLAGVMSIAMENDPKRAAAAGTRLDAAATAMRDAVTPLLAALDRSQLRAVESVEDTGGDSAPASAADDTAPAADDTAPAADDTAPTADDTAPAADDTAPAAGDGGQARAGT
jgi:hypothetical protein